LERDVGPEPTAGMRWRKVLRYSLVSLISIAVSQLDVRQHATSLAMGPLRG
jgi:hypothetical protein